MKATLRKNGLMMFTVAVRIDVGRDELIDAVRDHLLMAGTVRPNRSALMRLVKSNHLVCHTTAEWEDTDEWKKATVDATAIVDKAFPELKQ